VLRSVSLALVAVMSFGATGFATGYVRLQNNIETHNIENLLGTRPQPVEHVDPTDPNAGQALNILLMGSDTRDGENAALGGENDGMRSDTTILAHISADRTRMELVSIPRDSRVDIPSCNYNDGSSSRPESARFNKAFAIGADHNDDIGEAAACTVHTVEELTGVFINEWAVVDFAGFRNMIDALGGVQMCIPEELYSEKAQLHLLPGSQTLDGTQALGLARARTGLNLGDGSDLMRLGRQQQLLGAIAQGAMSKNMLTDAPALYRFLTAASQSLTTSEELGSIPDLVGLAFSLKDMPSGNLVFMTIPNAANPDDRNEVVWTSEADQVWSNIKNDVPIVTPAASTTPATPGAGTTPAAPTTPTTVPTPGVDPITADDVVTVCG
jgi:LCP family protein required for cell wall assembly